MKTYSVGMMFEIDAFEGPQKALLCNVGNGMVILICIGGKYHGELWNGMVAVEDRQKITGGEMSVLAARWKFRLISDRPSTKIAGLKGPACRAAGRRKKGPLLRAFDFSE